MSTQSQNREPARSEVPREQVVELLEFARTEIRSQLDTEACPHDGWFATEDVGCWACKAAAECAWLLHNDGVMPWHLRSLGDLTRALELSVQLIDLQAKRWEHNTRNCRCEVCRWIRSARHALSPEEHPV